LWHVVSMHQQQQQQQQEWLGCGSAASRACWYVAAAAAAVPVAVVVHLVGAAVEHNHGVIGEVVGVGMRPWQYTYYCGAILVSLIMNSTCATGHNSRHRSRQALQEDPWRAISAVT